MPPPENEAQTSSANAPPPPVTNNIINNNMINNNMINNANNNSSAHFWTVYSVLYKFKQKLRAKKKAMRKKSNQQQIYNKMLKEAWGPGAPSSLNAASSSIPIQQQSFTRQLAFGANEVLVKKRSGRENFYNNQTLNTLAKFVSAAVLLATPVVMYIFYFIIENIDVLDRNGTTDS